MDINSFKTGDVVSLNSGGPKLTVSAVHQTPDIIGDDGTVEHTPDVVECIFFDEVKYAFTSQSFHSSMIRLEEE